MPNNSDKRYEAMHRGGNGNLRFMGHARQRAVDLVLYLLLEDFSEKMKEIKITYTHTSTL